MRHQQEPKRFPPWERGDWRHSRKHLPPTSNALKPRCTKRLRHG